MSRVKFDCVHVDTCLPDYRSGHHLPHVAIPVWHGMKLSEIKQALRDEIRWGYIMGNNEDARLLSADFISSPEDEKLADKLIKAVYAAISRLKPAKKGQRRFFKELDKSVDDSDESVYAYFVFKRV